jgi:hypothetical protein
MNIQRTNTLEVEPPATNRTLRFHARDVTGSHEILVEGVERGALAGSVAQSLAARMDLPTDVPWALRSDRTGAWLKDDAPLGEQINGEAEARLTITPKTHLGGEARE